MEQVDKLMLDTCTVDIIEHLKPGLKFKALIMKKGVLSREVVDDIFEGEDREENTYNFVKELSKKTSAAVTMFIEALEESEQRDLAETLKKIRGGRSGTRASKDGLRRGIIDALRKGSRNVHEEGRVAVDDDYLEQCKQFARGITDVVPGEFKCNPRKIGASALCISRECALELSSHLGGGIEVMVARRNSGLMLARQSDGEAVSMEIKLVIKSDGEDTVEGFWVLRERKIEYVVQKGATEDYQKVTDAKGKEVDVKENVEDWWPTAPVGSSGDKELHIWVKPTA